MRPELVLTGLGLAALALGPVYAELPLAASAHSDAASAALDLSWSVGGTLHHVTAAGWIAASVENQLATASDWTLAFPNMHAAITTNEELFKCAERLRACVSEAALDERTAGRATRASDIAAACAVTMDWLSPAQVRDHDRRNAARFE